MRPKGNEPREGPCHLQGLHLMLLYSSQTQTADSAPGRTGHAGISAAFSFTKNTYSMGTENEWKQGEGGGARPTTLEV